MSDLSVTVNFDPVRDNIVSRVARGCRMSGPAEMTGGMLLQGAFRGDLVVRGGPLWVYDGAEISDGTVYVDGDIYVLGCVGRRENPHQTVLRCSGVLHVTEIGTVFADMHCRYPIFYPGSKTMGSLNTLEFSAE